ncbi:MAG TPA: amidohydrolase [Flavobacteriales bacterium]|nr:amidohydrolase [Flavobacteriales bacterium]HMR26824.1 amidohydrolase [Flavobacteriales bacterium]
MRRTSIPSPVNDGLLRKLVYLRRELHAHPETAMEEHWTADRIKRYLEVLAPDALLTHVGGTGVLACFGGRLNGPELLFRCELDALPIEEENDFAHRSTIEGRSHKCGHDGHMAILCGLAERLAAERPASGRVWLLFQPAEENGLGAEAVLADPRVRGMRFDRVFALHNLPGIPKGTVMLRTDSFTAAVNSIIITLKGRTSHAAEPEHGINPAAAMGELITRSLALDHNVPSDAHMRVVTPVFARLGSKDYGISAGSAEVHLTLRCWHDAELERLQREVEAIANEVGVRHRLKLDITYTQHFHANRNDAATVDLVREAVEAEGLDHRVPEHPFKFGEDFGLFTQRFPGCMFGLGAGEGTPALHNPDYDFPEDLLPQGIAVFERIVRQLT